MATTFEKHQNQILYANLRRTGSIDPSQVKFDPSSGDIFSVGGGANTPWSEQGYQWARDAVTAANRRRGIEAQIASDRRSPATFFGEGTYAPGKVTYETTESGVPMPTGYTPAQRKNLEPGQSYRRDVYDEKTGEYKGFVMVRNPLPEEDLDPTKPGVQLYSSTTNDQGQALPLSNESAKLRRPYIAQQLSQSEAKGTGAPIKAVAAMTPEERVAWMNSKNPSSTGAFGETFGLPGAPKQGEIERMGAAQDKAASKYKRDQATAREKKSLQESRERAARNPENTRANYLDMLQEEIAANGPNTPYAQEIRRLAEALGGLGPIDKKKIKKEDAAEADLNRKAQIVAALASNNNADMIRAWDHLMTPRERAQSVSMRSNPNKKPNWKDPVVQGLLFGSPKPKRKGR